MRFDKPQKFVYLARNFRKKISRVSIAEFGRVVYVLTNVFAEIGKRGRKRVNVRCSFRYFERIFAQTRTLRRDAIP